MGISVPVLACFATCRTHVLVDAPVTKPFDSRCLTCNRLPGTRHFLGRLVGNVSGWQPSTASPRMRNVADRFPECGELGHGPAR